MDRQDQEGGNPDRQGLEGHQDPWASQPPVEQGPGKWWSCIEMDLGCYHLPLPWASLDSLYISQHVLPLHGNESVIAKSYS